MAILTNKLDVTIDYEEFDKLYDLFEVSKDGGRLSRSSRALEPLGAPYILSVLGQNRERPFYILAPHGVVTAQELRSHFEHVYEGQIEGENLEASNEGSYLMPRKATSPEVESHVLVQLMLNALTMGNATDCSLQNVTGHLYCLNTANGRIKRNKKDGRCYQVIALEIGVTPELFLTASVRTFTRANASGLVFDTKRPEMYPKYVMDLNGPSMRRVAPGEKPSPNDVFIPKQYEGQKNRVPFLQYKSKRAFNDSKCGLLKEVIDLFNERYEGIARISFASIDVSAREATLTELSNFDLTSAISKHDWVVVDVDHDAAGTAACNAIADWLARDELLGKRPRIEKVACPDANNLTVLHERGYYKSIKLEDPYKACAPKGTICQHVNIETIQAEMGKDSESSNLRFLLPRCLVDDEIKRDISRGKMALYSWESLGYEAPLIFASAGPESEEERKARKREAPNRYSFVEVGPMGELGFHLGHVDRALGGSKWDEYACELAGAWSYATDGYVIDNCGDIDIIESTKGFPIPDLEYVQSKIEDIDWALPKYTVFDVLLHDTGDPTMDVPLAELRGKIVALATSKVKSTKLNALIREATAHREGGCSSRALRKMLDERLEDALSLSLLTCVPRDAAAIERGYESLVNMHCIWEEDSLLYWTDRFNGLDQVGRANGSVIRRVRNLQGGRPFFTNLLETLTIPIARLNSPSVLPLPFKYLREWMATVEIGADA